MTFEEEEYKKLNEHDVLWKYLDFHKFVDLISNKTLHFTRLDQFEDPFEGISKRILTGMKYWSQPLILDQESRLTEKAINHNNNQAKKIKEDYQKEKNEQKNKFVNCWVKLDRESMAMWDLYSNSNSIAILINGKKFIENLRLITENQKAIPSDNSFIVGNVSYEDKYLPPVIVDNDSTVKSHTFIKDVTFIHENEYRLAILSPNNLLDNNPKFHKLNLYDGFFDDIVIVCHPKMEDWKFKNIECICKKFHLNPPRKSEIKLNF